MSVTPMKKRNPRSSSSPCAAYEQLDLGSGTWASEGIDVLLLVHDA